MTALPPAFTTAFYAEIKSIGVRQAHRDLKALGYEYRGDRWHKPGAVRSSKDSWNSK